eukprot:6193091-Pleurochrysis_carterae.AAC.4
MRAKGWAGAPEQSRGTLAARDRPAVAQPAAGEQDNRTRPASIERSSANQEAASHPSTEQESCGFTYPHRDVRPVVVNREGPFARVHQERRAVLFEEAALSLRLLPELEAGSAALRLLPRLLLLLPRLSGLDRVSHTHLGAPFVHVLLRLLQLARCKHRLAQRAPRLVLGLAIARQLSQVQLVQGNFFQRRKHAFIMLRLAAYEVLCKGHADAL